MPPTLPREEIPAYRSLRPCRSRGRVYRRICRGSTIDRGVKGVFLHLTASVYLSVYTVPTHTAEWNDESDESSLWSAAVVSLISCNCSGRGNHFWYPIRDCQRRGPTLEQLGGAEPSGTGDRKVWPGRVLTNCFSLRVAGSREDAVRPSCLLVMNRRGLDTGPLRMLRRWSVVVP